MYVVAYPVMLNSPEQQINCLKIAETSVVLIVFTVVLFEVCAKGPSWLWL